MRKYNYYILILVVLLSVFAGSALADNDGSRYTTTSKLASGKWIKLKVTDNAIYKLTYDDIKKMGISDPSKVKIYGSGGWILDEDFKKPYVDDLQEIAVWVNKGTDGVFNSGDYLLFYGRGTVKWTFIDNKFEQENNPYATYGAYFMTESESGPKEMQTQASVAQTAVSLNTFDDYLLHERDSITIANTGRELFGESFVSKNTQTFNFSIPGITAASVSLSFAARPSFNCPLILSLNEQQVINTYVPNQSNYDAFHKALLLNTTETWSGPVSDDVVAKIYYPAGNQTIAYLNYIRFNVSRILQPYGSFTLFRNKDSRRVSARYEIENVTSNNYLVFDLTDPFNARKVEATLSGNRLSFGVQSGDTIREFALVDPTKSFKTPESLGEVQNQNLHGLAQTEMVILAPKPFLTQAEVLAEAHRKHSGLHVTVVQADLVFNEFSSGVPDATAYRRFMKMFYDRATSESEKPKYLLLFGDGIFDNRFLTPGASKLSKDYYLLTYQVKESVNETNSYGTDDYFGFLDDKEGVYIGSDGIDLGIGRFPVNSEELANNVVNKVIGYMDNLNYSEWKNMITFAADDTDPAPNYWNHAQQIERLATYLENEHPEYMLTKVYQDAFKQETVNGKKVYPDARKKLLNALKNGCFLLDYMGHGKTTAWTSEDLLTITDINQMSFSSLPLWITATCDFGWFDGLSGSAGEAAFLNKKSGAIALYTTTRVVNAPNNEYINDKLIRNIFSKTNGQHLRLGDILRISKNQLPGDYNKLNYALLGDPALMLNYPEDAVLLDAINGQPVEPGETLTFKALDKVTLTGRIVDAQGDLQSDFNGTIHATIFDGIQRVTAQNNTLFTYNDYPNMISMINSEVKNGQFTVTFKVPLDISYSDSKGKLSLYAFDETNKEDAGGYLGNYVFNGTGEMPQEAGKGPEIKSMYLNALTFKDGDQVNETPYFVAEVYDEDGINISGGSLGHEISICIDNSPVYTYNLNNYFESTSEVYGEGTVKFSIPPLPVGEHTLVFRVWDLLNNSSSDTLKFTVVQGLKPRLYDITAMGNPAKVNTFFLLSHDRPDTPIEVEIKVYDLTGRPFWTHRETGSSEWLKKYAVEWDLRADNGMRLKPGVYIYQAIIKSGSSKEATKAKKIIILGQ